MTFLFKYGATIYEKPIRDVLQRWRRSLASLLFFTILLTENFGLSSCILNHSIQHSTEIILKDIFGINSFEIPHISSQTQCLYIDRNTSQTMCSLKSEQRKLQARDARLKFCNFYTVSSLVNQNILWEKCMQGSAQDCEQCFEELEYIDAGLYALMCSFEEMLARYDCHHHKSSSSTRFSCLDCQEAYKDWLCSSNLKYYGDEGNRGTPIPPCRQYCTAVLARCPYFLPDPENQYSGEPAFLCRSDHEHDQGELPKACYSPDLIPGPHTRHKDLADYVGTKAPRSARGSASLTNWPPSGAHSRLVLVILLLSWPCMLRHLVYHHNEAAWWT